MQSSKEIDELEKLSKSLAPKNGCRVCKIVLVAAAILFVSSLLLAVYALKQRSSGVELMNPPIVLTTQQSNQHFKTLRDEYLKEVGTSTILIGKPTIK